jgi:hypothetical protein
MGLGKKTNPYQSHIEWLGFWDGYEWSDLSTETIYEVAPRLASQERAQRERSQREENFSKQNITPSKRALLNTATEIKVIEAKIAHPAGTSPQQAIQKAKSIHPAGGSPRAQKMKAKRASKKEKEKTLLSQKELPLLSLKGAWREVGIKILIVDLDNLIAQKDRMKIRMNTVLILAREADHVFIAGRENSVAVAKPHLAEFGNSIRTVKHGNNSADHSLISVTKNAIQEGEEHHFIVVSNDHIFAQFSRYGSLSVATPKKTAIAGKLRLAATDLLDLVEIEDATGQLAS